VNQLAYITTSSFPCQHFFQKNFFSIFSLFSRTFSKFLDLKKIPPKEKKMFKTNAGTKSKKFHHLNEFQRNRGSAEFKLYRADKKRRKNSVAEFGLRLC